MRKLNLAGRWLLFSLLCLLGAATIVAGLSWTKVIEQVDQAPPAGGAGQTNRRVVVEVRERETGEHVRRHIFDADGVEVETEIGFLNGDKAIVSWDKASRTQTYVRRTREGKQLDYYQAVIASAHAKREVEVSKERFWLAFQTHLFDEKGVKLETHRTLRSGEGFDDDRRAYEIYTYFPDGRDHTFARYADNGQVLFTFEYAEDRYSRTDTTWRLDGTLETYGRNRPDGSYISKQFWFDGKTPFEVVERGPGNLPDLVRTYYRKDGSLWVRSASIRPKNAAPYSIEDHDTIEEYRADGTLELKLDWGLSSFDLTVSLYRTNGTIEKRYQVVSNWGSAYHEWDWLAMRKTEVFDDTGKLLVAVDFNEQTSEPTKAVNADGSSVSTIAPDWLRPPLVRQPEKAFEAQDKNPALRGQLDR